MEEQKANVRLALTGLTGTLVLELYWVENGVLRHTVPVISWVPFLWYCQKRFHPPGHY